jgi:hypothetical protein
MPFMRVHLLGFGAVIAVASCTTSTTSSVVDASTLPDASKGAACDAGGAGNACDAGTSCNTVNNGACPVVTQLATGSLPTFTGGQIADGTYYLVGADSYGGAGAQGQVQRITMVFSAGTMQLVQDSDAQCNAAPTGTASYTTNGSTLSLTYSCPGAATAQVTYSATASQFVYREAGSTSGVVVFTFTRQ